MMELVSRLEGRLIVCQIVEMSGFLNKKDFTDSDTPHSQGEVRTEALSVCVCVFLLICL